MKYYAIDRNETFFKHHGVKGQKWGVRRYKNKDGSLTDAGKKRSQSNEKTIQAAKKAFDKSYAKLVDAEKYREKDPKRYKKEQKEADEMILKDANFRKAMEPFLDAAGKEVNNLRSFQRPEDRAKALWRLESSLAEVANKLDAYKRSGKNKGNDDEFFKISHFRYAASILMDERYNDSTLSDWLII